jgi:hypothetical protein
VIVRDLAFDADLDRMVCAFANENAAGKVRRPDRQTVIDEGMNVDRHSDAPYLFVNI